MQEFYRMCSLLLKNSKYMEGKASDILECNVIVY